MKNKKIILSVIVILVIIVTIFLALVGNYFVSYAIERKPSGFQDPLSPTYQRNPLEVSNTAIAKEKVDAWQKTVVSNEVAIKSYDDLELWSKEYENKNSNMWVINVHGYTSSHASMQDFAYEFYQRGYSVLTPDLRAHGNSEGEYIGMGLNDSKDILSWIEYINDKNPDAEIVLHGVSMGAATVMITAGDEELPENVVAVIEDSGYTSAYQMMKEQLETRFSLPSFPILNVAELVGRVKAGYFLSDANPMKSLENSEVPMLFIHGDKDTFVLPYMQNELYDSYKGYKETLTIKGAEHVASRNLEPDTYYNKVFSFIDNAKNQ